MIDDLLAEHLEALREDLAYHQTRVLLLVTAVAATDGHNRKLDGLTKLAKLDFLTRYPALGPVVLDGLSASDNRLHIERDSSDMSATDVEAPMTRYKYGPWDDRYYPVIGALVGRGLVKYVKGRKGSVALSPTPAGKKLAKDIGSTDDWQHINDRCAAVAEASAGLNGTTLKNLIYSRLPALMDRPHRELIK
ncbi:hypothetical protein [Mycobacteroides abscessus]|jgi:hypothetical protein|uniref:Uncharacterized protein n=2 Tax=Mycobacteroides abscessus TaxID=36809 RepID=A0A1U5R4H5_9MYCO|nr:hypothetical protein [Mycobacteroides abscessus]MBE5431921.1 hypothetical protein [Mycobacteroides abscessus]MBE5504031.1 hypothetical protein [Mycobacteroides abscessus]MBE5516018.1 hypothetical protein [Mycobacteroides abscessus]MBN7427786.1 hypothetical protein [Mycobacteroides abscessus subsp. massiliense]MBN7465593.1 hypothetical protein [Mycobacteroides abscessus subsp. massiliense]